MATKLFVGGLAYAITEQKLRELFEPIGTVTSAQLIMDRYSGQSKGFGFVEMGSEAEAKTAIEKLNGTEVEGRKIIVSEARPQEDRPRPSFGGGFGRNDNRGDHSRGRRY